MGGGTNLTLANLIKNANVTTYTYRGQGQDLVLHGFFFVVTHPRRDCRLLLLLVLFLLRHKLFLLSVEISQHGLNRKARHMQQSLVKPTTRTRQHQGVSLSLSLSTQMFNHTWKNKRKPENVVPVALLPKLKISCMDILHLLKTRHALSDPIYLLKKGWPAFVNETRFEMVN